MTQSPLKRLISHHRQEIAGLVGLANAQFVAAIQIFDLDGHILFGQGAESTERLPVQVKGETVGWVTGCQGGELVAIFLAQCLVNEEEKRRLADEALNRYREVNLLYSLSGKLAASLDVKQVALTAIEEAQRLIKFSTGALLLANTQTRALEWVAGIGPKTPPIPPGEGIQSRVVRTGKAEVINDVCVEEDHSLAEAGFCALLCSPLEVKGQVIGILMLASDTPVTYSAGDLKLLNTVASQAAPAIENALLYEAALREAREREERLQRQIQALRIELDENRQAKKVGEITDTEYFRSLQQQAERLRDIVDGREGNE